MKYLATGLLGLSLFVAACEDPAANKAKALVTDSATNSTNTTNTSGTETAPATAPALKGEALPINAENSKVEFTGSKVTGKHEGGFKELTGRIDWVDNKVEGSNVFVEIDTTSVFSDDEKLTGHLKSADFFDVQKFPKATFTSTKIVPNPTNGADAYTVSGDFNLHGVTKGISFPATIKTSAEGVTVNAEFSINRKDFGIVYAGKADDLIRDDVVIRLDLNTQKKK